MSRVFKAAAVALLLGAAPASAQQPVEVTFWYGISGQLADVLNDVVNRFNAQNPRYKVTAVYKGYYIEVLNTAIAAYRAGRPPHFIQVHEATAQTMLGSNAVVPVQDMMTERNYKVDWNDFVAPLVNWYKTTDGKLMSMPFNTSTPLLYWNKAHFKKAGLDPEKAPATWTELGDAMAKLKSAGICGFAEDGTKWVHLEYYSFAQDIPSGTKRNGYDGLDTTLSYNNDQILRHLERVKGWVDDGRARFTGKATRNAWLAQDCAMFYTSSASQGGLEIEAKFDWGAAALPIEDGKPAFNGNIGGATLWVFKGHKKEEYDAIAAFFHYLTDPDVQLDWHKRTGYVPITKSAAKRAEETGYYKEKPHRQVALQQLTRPVTDNTLGLRFGNHVEIRAVMDEEIDAFFLGKKSAKAAMDDMVRRGNELLRQYQRQQAAASRTN
jgi:sn-glycerol 3-phosphate transport system substrate-binding protein